MNLADLELHHLFASIHSCLDNHMSECVTVMSAFEKEKNTQVNWADYHCASGPAID